MAEALRLAAESDPAAEHLPILAYAGDDVSLKVLQSVATDFGQPFDIIRRGNLEDACERAAAGLSVGYALLDIDEVDEPSDLLHMFVAEAQITYGVVAFGSKNDIHLYRELTDAGAIDYLVKPLSKNAIDAALSAAESRIEQRRHIEAMSAATRAASNPAKLTLFVAARGGVGCSTIAVNTGWCIAHTLSKRTVLVDLDLQYGISALALDLDPGRGLREILGHPDRMDSLLLSSAMVRENENFSVLGAEEPIEDVISFEPEAIDALMLQLRGDYDQVLVDLPRALLPAYRPLIDMADRIVLITDLTLAGIRDSSRILHMLENAGKRDNVTLLASRVGPERKAQVGKPQFEKGVKHKIDLVVPEDFKHVSASANAGRSVPALSKSAPSAKAFQALAEILAGERPSKGGLRSLFKSKPKTQKNRGDADLGEALKVS
ncbi:MAG: hypothetical protein WD489_01675 [Rhodovibrionaceae bacterium]